ncbi:hypothetical protein E2562_033469, partial [Oryza meyeriana var. granulata]
MADWRLEQRLVYIAAATATCALPEEHRTPLEAGRLPCCDDRRRDHQELVWERRIARATTERQGTSGLPFVLHLLLQGHQLLRHLLIYYGFPRHQRAKLLFSVAKGDLLLTEIGLNLEMELCL